MTTIKKGYRITAVSWENDADHYRTITLEGLSREDASFFADVAEVLLRRGFGLENECDYFYAGPTKYLDAFEKEGRRLCQKYGKEERMDVIMDAAYELMGGSETYYMRVLESFVVEYVPEDIVLEDVTKEFLQH